MRTSNFGSDRPEGDSKRRQLLHCERLARLAADLEGALLNTRSYASPGTYHGNESHAHARMREFCGSQSCATPICANKTLVFR